jgi:hypothetical protein
MTRSTPYGNVYRAAMLALDGCHAHAALVCADAITHWDAPNAWMLPVEPLLNAASHPREWASTLALLRDRSS